MPGLKLKLVAIYFGNPKSGISRKVIHQVGGLIKYGINAAVLFLGNKKENEEVEQPFIQFLPVKGPPYRSFKEKFDSLKSFRKNYEKILLEGDEQEIIYLRNYLPAFWFYKAVKKSKKRILLELPSNHFKETLARKSYFYYLGICLFHKPILRNVDLIISVTSEIIDLHFNPQKWNIPCMIIGNGIDVNAVSLRQRSIPAVSKEYVFTCVAEFTLPHGVDRLLRGLKQYRGAYTIKLNMVGSGSELRNLQELAAQLELPNVIFRGYLSGKELDAIFEDTDLAIGALAIHRSGIEYSSILKAREYCARGIPFVNSGKDEEFPESFPFVHQIRSSEEPIDINELVEFVRKVAVIPGYKTQMRQYAADVLAWDVKMKKLSGYLYDRYSEPVNS
jgi:glycosyltransferase involved in cell wall biosynthesis